MSHKRNVYERTLQKDYSFRVLIKGLESELRKWKTSEARARRENRILRAIARIHRLPVSGRDPERFAQAVCDTLRDECAYRDAWIALHTPEVAHAFTDSSNCASGFTERLCAVIAHEGISYGRLVVSVLLSGDDREEEIRLLSEVASEIGLGLHRVEIRDEKLPAWQGGQEFSLPVGALCAAQL